MKLKLPELTSTTGLWTVYVFLLLVLLPHTAWAWALFEPATKEGRLVAWFAAIAFEFAILVLTRKLATHIETTPKHKSRWLRFSRRYLNAYAGGLLVALGVSALANLAHAVEFGRTMAILAGWSWGFYVYAAGFGAILPFTSLLFARVLAHVADGEGEPDPELVRARQDLAELRAQFHGQAQALAGAEGRAALAEGAARFLLELAAEDKARRILAAHEQWPQLPQSGIAVVTNTSPAYVSEVLQTQAQAER